MSTRCNIVIKSKDDKMIQLYHHYDGYPEGVGEELGEFIAHLISSGMTDILADPETLGHYLNEQKKLYEYEEGIGLHRDIEYLYVITIKDDVIGIVCYNLDIYGEADDLEIIYGRYKPKENELYERVYSEGYAINKPKVDKPASLEDEVKELRETIKKLEQEIAYLRSSLGCH